MTRTRTQPRPLRPVDPIGVQADAWKLDDGRYRAMIRSSLPPGATLYDMIITGPYLSPQERRDLEWGARIAGFDKDAAALLIEQAIRRITEEAAKS